MEVELAMNNGNRTFSLDYKGVAIVIWVTQTKNQARFDDI